MSKDGNPFRVIRTIVFGLVSVSSFIVLCLCISIRLDKTDTHYFALEVFALANASLTLLTLPTMLYLSLQRKGAFVSLVSFEVWWTFFLWIIWLAFEGLSAPTRWSIAKFGLCELPYYWNYWANQKKQPVCRHSQAVTGLAFLNSIALFCYNMTLFILIARQSRRGNSTVWKGYINETDFSARDNQAIPSNTQAGVAPQNMAPAVAIVVPTQQPQVAPTQHMTSHYPEV